MKKFYLFLSTLLFTWVTSSAFAQVPIYIGKLKDIAATYKTKAQQANTSGTPGAQVSHLLPGGKPLTLKLKSSKLEGVASLFYGEVSDSRYSSFNLAVSGRNVSGSIIMREEKRLFRYSSTPDGSVYLTEEDIDKVLCVGIPKDEKRKEKGRVEPAQAPTVATAVPILQSLPGAGAVLYLDFDGQTVSNTLWNSNFNSGNPIVAAPSTLSEAEITEAWKLISEDFRPFALNVTTSEAVFNSVPANRRMRVIFTPTNYFYPNAGGAAYVGSFTWAGTSYGETPCFVWNTSIKGAGEAGTHEAGHTLQLSHDGRTNPVEGYFEGQGSWAPVMGAGYYVPVVQWSKGEYPYANNTEDDLSKISTLNGFGYRLDDHGNTSTTATPLVVGTNGDVFADNNKGVISTRTDVDVFSFTSPGGVTALTVSPDPTHPNLDISLTLRNSAGTVVATEDPSTLAASLSTTLAAGTYYLTVDGVAGSMGANSDYGSLGSYTIASTIYCKPIYVSSCSSQDYINNLSFNTLVNNNSGCGSGSTSGYTNYAPISTYTTAVNKGVTYSLKLQSGPSYAQGFGVWIDYNQDKDFDDAGEFIYGSPSATTNLLTANVTIPTTATPGTTRMRVRSRFSGILSATDACNSFSYGEAEDYTISISFNTSPTVSLTAPAAGAVFINPAAINITANAADPDGTVAKVEFFAGTIKLGEDLTAPYSYSWAGAAAGTYSLTARVTDNQGKFTTSSSKSITVKTTTPPTVSLTSPLAGSTFSVPATITINANAADTDGTIAKVEFYRGTTKLGEDLTAPYSYTWTGATVGTYSLTAKAIDNIGATATSAAVSIIVTDNAAPTVSLTAPAAGAIFTIPATVTISANAADPDGTVAKVEFYAGSTKVGEDLIAPYSYSWTGAAAGTYSITAKAIDNQGKATTSSARSITVAGNAGPIVSITSPTTGATFSAPATINITANATDPDGTVSKVEFYVGTTKLREDLTAPYSYSWSGVAMGTYSLTAKATDNLGKVTTSAVVSVTITSCAPTYTMGCSDGDFINNFSFNTLVNDNSGCGGGTATGYTIYPASGTYTTAVTPGQAYTLKVQSGAAYPQGLGVWIDYNGDRDFNDAGEFVYKSSSATTSLLTATITIPTTAVAGPRQMRVRSRYNAILASTDACSSISYGEAEDYTITINTPTTPTVSAINSAVSEAGLQSGSGNTLRVYPNPFTDDATVEFAFAQDEEYSVKIYSANGTLVKTLTTGKAKAKSIMQVKWVDKQTAAGLYFVRLESKQGVQTLRVMKR